MLIFLFFSSFFSLWIHYCTAVDIFERRLVGTIIFFFYGNLQKSFGKKQLFSSLQKKEKNQLTELFSGREFLLADCPRRRVFYQSFNFIVFFPFNHPETNLIYLNKEFHYFIPHLSFCSLIFNLRFKLYDSLFCVTFSRRPFFAVESQISVF